MRRIGIVLTSVLFLAAEANAAVFLSEVFINPPGSDDDTREFIELQGTPGMKLDGYAVAVANGTLMKYYPLNSIPPIPSLAPEIDEFFSLDGLSLGPNGLLVIGIGSSAFYPTLLSDTHFQRWDTLWNGGLDTPGKLSNDGSNTILLLRNRPGITQADPTAPGGLRWGKDIAHDAELIRPVIDLQDGLAKDQYGDGNPDKGQPDGMGGYTLDLKGASTSTIADDLEVVDEVSYEQDRGWEYDLDGRHVDNGSTSNRFPARHVHALDDPQGFNPDVLTRVDCRTKGPGWTPVNGATGEMANGNNWQDTATEQWIRGDSVGSGGAYYYDNGANTNPDAIQPYRTHVPLWLNDGAGADYNFAAMNTYPIMAGRVNPLAIPFIPGDADRDGDCDADDIARIVAVFGNADWIFSNSFAEAPEGDSGNPAVQIRPWDVDATGDNGIEASDLQWTLNFQGDSTGRIVGRRYDSTTPTPPGAGVYLKSNNGVACTVSVTASVPGGRNLESLRVGDSFELTVSARVTSGANTAAGQQNGVMQYVHDLTISTGGVVKVVGVQSLGAFTTTRSSIQSLQGVNGDRGVALINGYATDFTQGLSSSASLYRVTLKAIGLGNADASVSASTAAGFAAGTPAGLKVGHTDFAGNPAAATYPGAIRLTVLYVPSDFDLDGDVDLGDFTEFQRCFNGPNNPPAGPPTCVNADSDEDGDVDLTDFTAFQACFNGPNRPPACS